MENWRFLTGNGHQERLFALQAPQKIHTLSEPSLFKRFGNARTMNFNQAEPASVYIEHCVRRWLLTHVLYPTQSRRIFFGNLRGIEFCNFHVVKRKRSRRSTGIETQAAVRIGRGRHLELERIGFHIRAKIKILLFLEVARPRVIVLFHIHFERAGSPCACIKAYLVPLVFFKMQVVLNQLHLVILRTDSGNVKLVLSIFRITSRSGIAM